MDAAGLDPAMHSPTELEPSADSDVEAAPAQDALVSACNARLTAFPTRYFNPDAGTGLVPGCVGTSGNLWYNNVNLDDPNNVRYTPEKPDGTPGNVTYVFVPNPKLPLIAGTGLLEPALDKILRPIIEAGYSRPGGVGTAGSAQAASAAVSASSARVAKPTSRARAARLAPANATGQAEATGQARSGTTKNRP